MTFLPLIILAICFALGMPVAYAMICCVIPYFIADPYMSANIIIQRMVANTESTSMMAAPFFIIAGAIMNYSGISKRIYDFAGALVGHLVGGLGHVNVIVSAMMGGISGSGLADAAYDCKVLLPQMEAHGYSRAYSGALSAATAVITPIIPPGVSLVMFAVLCEVSVGKLLTAGYIPGLMLTVAMLLLNHFICKKRGYQAERTERVDGKTLWKLFREAAWALAIPFGLVLGLRIGIFNATEGAAVIAAYSLFVGKFVYKELKWKDIPAILKESVQGVGPVLMILCASNVLSYYLSWERIPQMLTQSMIALCHNKYVFLILVNLLMLVVGMFLDSFAAMIIIAPARAGRHRFWNRSCTFRTDAVPEYYHWLHHPALRLLHFRRQFHRTHQDGEAVQGAGSLHHCVPGHLGSGDVHTVVLHGHSQSDLRCIVKFKQQKTRNGIFRSSFFLLPESVVILNFN